MIKKVEISHRTIFFTIFFLLFIWLLYYIREIILIFFISLLTMSILNPSVTKLTKYKIPRAVSVLVIYLILLLVMAGATAGIVPPLVEQTSNFINSLPAYLENIGLSKFVSQEMIRDLVLRLGSIPGQILRISVSVFSNLLSVLTILILAFYLLIARDKLDDYSLFLFGDGKKEKISEIMNLLETKLGGWARGQIALMTLIGISSYIGLIILGIPYALPLAILAGLLEVVPNLGPTLSAVPAAIIGFGINTWTGFASLALYFLIQQVENYLFVPKVMEKSAGVNPIATLLAVMIGFRLAGVVGVIISVPVYITLMVFSSYYYSSKK